MIDVRQLQHSAGVSAVPDVLPIVPVLRCQTHQAAWHFANWGDRLQGPAQSRPRALDELWAFRTRSSRFSQDIISDYDGTVRTPDTDETPLSPTEARLAMRDYPLESNHGS